MERFGLPEFLQACYNCPNLFLWTSGDAAAFPVPEGSMERLGLPELLQACYDCSGLEEMPPHFLFQEKCEEIPTAGIAFSGLQALRLPKLLIVNG
jgi:hypothetical protein